MRGNYSTRSIEVAYYDDDLGRRVVYRGQEKGAGHFQMQAPDVNGEGNLHRFKDGWWHEDTYEGMWRIKLKP